MGWHGWLRGQLFRQLGTRAVQARFVSATRTYSPDESIAIASGYYLEDPNNPNTDPLNGYVSVPPRRRSLSLKVIDRLNKQQADEATKKSYYMVSPWSEATKPVSLPSTSGVFTGEVEPAHMAAGAEGSLVQQTEAYGNVVPVVWNDELAIDVSTETRGYRGSVLNFTKKQFDVLDPVSLVIKMLKGYDFTSQYMVLDIRGGEDLPGDRKELVTSAGEYALVDDAGNFRVVQRIGRLQGLRALFVCRRDSSDAPLRPPGTGRGGMMPGGHAGGGLPGAACRALEHARDRSDQAARQAKRWPVGQLACLRQRRLGEYAGTLATGVHFVA